MEDTAIQRHLQDGTKRVVEQAFFMKRAMASDHGDAISAMNFAGEMLKELKTTNLSPKSYYELYMKILDELHALEDFFWALSRQGFPMVELYERAQAQAAVLPRLYIMITVGGCYIRSLEAPAHDLLRDLVEMCKGVQHPLRGLFLRNYLAHVTKDKLPDVGTPYEGQGGTVQHSVEFVLENFTEANRLWVRMHHQGPAKDKKRRERERKDLRLLVGTNLVRLSQLEGVDVVRYRDFILPRILEQVVACRDTVAQSYLMDCIIQVFPDDFHIYTLDAFLEAVGKLKDKVRVRPILESLMERLANYVEAGAGAGGAGGDGEEAGAALLPPEIKAFQAFNACAARLIAERPNLPLSEIVMLQMALMNFAIKCYPSRLEYVNHCIGVTGKALAVHGIAPGGQNLPPDCVEPLERLLSVPLRSLALRVLELGQYPELVRFLPWPAQRQVSAQLLRAVLASDGSLADVATVDKLLGTISPLLRDPDPAAAAIGAAAGGGPEEQLLVARMVHLFRSDDTDMLFRILVVSRRHFAQGGRRHIQHTLVPLVFVALRLVRRVRAIELAAAVRDEERNAVAATAAAASAAAAAAAAEAAAQTAASSMTAPPQPPLPPPSPEPPRPPSAVGQDGEGEGDAAAADVADTSGQRERDRAHGGADGSDGTMADGSNGSTDGGEKPAAEEATDGGPKAEGTTAATSPAPATPPPRSPPTALPVTAALPAASPPPMPPLLPRPQFSSRKVFQFVHEVVTAMAPAFPGMSLKLFLHCAIAGDRAGFKAIAYEFVSQAFILYEDEITDSRAQMRALEQMVGTLVACGGFDDTDYDALATKTAQYAAKLLKKPDQCRMIVLCSHLFWVPETGASGGGIGGTGGGGGVGIGGWAGGRQRGYRDGRRVLECLQRALKIADACMASGAHVQLFVEILDRYVYYFEEGNPEVRHRSFRFGAP
ncbi:unnamed protein product [Phaeothamnion confervicola]